MFKNIIFDWDNTLFPLKKYWNLAHRRIFLELLPLDTVTIDEFMAQYLIFDQKIWDQIHQGEISVAFGREERVRLVLDYFDIPYKPLFIKNFFDIYLTALIDEIKRDDVLVDRLLTLSKTYAISILSNGGSWEQREKIRQFGFEGVFPVYISEEVGLQKPDEAIFKCVLKNEHYEVSETLMVGDTLVHDIVPAQKLGMTGVYIGQEKGTGATFEFQTIADFLDAIEKNELKK